jgi:GNAT superfamily N-acetyltransferase
VAYILALAYSEDPIHIWTMPRTEKQLNDAMMFFFFYLRKMPKDNWYVYISSDYSAALVASLVSKGGSAYLDDVRQLHKILQKRSPAADYFQWIETYRPNIDHYYLDLIGCLPSQRSQGQGSFLMRSLLEKADQKGLPIWSWSSNPRNLTFYRRLGFEIGEELRRDAETPPVTILWRPPVRL